MNSKKISQTNNTRSEVEALASLVADIDKVKQELSLKELEKAILEEDMEAMVERLEKELNEQQKTVFRLEQEIQIAKGGTKA